MVNVKELKDHIDVIYELTGVQYVLRKDPVYEYKVCIQDMGNIMLFRGSLEKLNQQLANLEASARYWAS